MIKINCKNEKKELEVKTWQESNSSKCYNLKWTTLWQHEKRLKWYSFIFKFCV